MGNKTNRCGGIMKDNGKELSAKQSKYMDRNNDGKISDPDFAMMDGFDMKSQKPKNKRNFNKANDYNADKYDQSATQSNIMFDKKGPSVLYKKYCRK